MIRQVFQRSLAKHSEFAVSSVVIPSKWGVTRKALFVEDSIQAESFLILAFSLKTIVEETIH